MGKMKEPEKEDEELKKVLVVYCYMQWCAELVHYSLMKFYDLRLQVVTNQGISQAFIEKQKEPARAWRDDMNKIRDDPLLAIKQAEKRQREKIMDNPLKIAQFKEVCAVATKRPACPICAGPLSACAKILLHDIKWILKGEFVCRLCMHAHMTTMDTGTGEEASRERREEGHEKSG
jgi:hypothetical protein